jgi:hypothetical protein
MKYNKKKHLIKAGFLFELNLSRAIGSHIVFDQNQKMYEPKFKNDENIKHRPTDSQTDGWTDRLVEFSRAYFLEIFSKNLSNLPSFGRHLVFGGHLAF